MKNIGKNLFFNTVKRLQTLLVYDAQFFASISILQRACSVILLALICSVYFLPEFGVRYLIVKLIFVFMFFHALYFINSTLLFFLISLFYLVNSVFVILTLNVLISVFFFKFLAK